MNEKQQAMLAKWKKNAEMIRKGLGFIGGLFAMIISITFFKLYEFQLDDFGPLENVCVATQGEGELLESVDVYPKFKFLL